MYVFLEAVGRLHHICSRLELEENLLKSKASKSIEVGYAFA